MTSLNLVSLETVKSQLEIADTTYDTQLSAMIPIVSADVRRILNYQFSKIHKITGTLGDSVLKTDIDIELGEVINSSGLESDTYVTGYDEEDQEYGLSSPVVADFTKINPTVNISQWPTIAKMVWYRVSKANKKYAADKELSSRKVGPLSVSFEKSDINSRYNYPQMLIDDLGAPYSKVGR